MSQGLRPVPQCDILVLLAISAEEKALREAARSHGTSYQGNSDVNLGRYFDLGKIGNDRVVAVRAEGMGPLGRRGSADLAMRFKTATAATAIVQLGMAFGIDEKNQRYGDVLVSSSLIPYDNRKYVQDGENSYRIVYDKAVPHEAGPIAYRFMNEASADRTERNYKVHVGAILSGGARIHSESFRDELIREIPPSGEPIVGGEMEGIGLLGVDEAPIWCIVKGISDFADRRRDEVIKKTRPIACANAANFFFATLLNPSGENII